MARKESKFNVVLEGTQMRIFSPYDLIGGESFFKIAKLESIPLDVTVLNSGSKSYVLAGMARETGYERVFPVETELKIEDVRECAGMLLRNKKVDGPIHLHGFTPGPNEPAVLDYVRTVITRDRRIFVDSLLKPGEQKWLFERKLPRVAKTSLEIFADPVLAEYFKPAPMGSRWLPYPLPQSA